MGWAFAFPFQNDVFGPGKKLGDGRDLLRELLELGVLEEFGERGFFGVERGLVGETLELVQELGMPSVVARGQELRDPEIRIGIEIARLAARIELNDLVKPVVRAHDVHAVTHLAHGRRQKRSDHWPLGEKFRPARRPRPETLSARLPSGFASRPGGLCLRRCGRGTRRASRVSVLQGVTRSTEPMSAWILAWMMTVVPGCAKEVTLRKHAS